jgi:hypothetical protein
MTSEKTALIRALNDALRTTQCGGRILVTSGVSSHGPVFVVSAINEIAAFDKFDENNDPWDEHDFGAITVSDMRLFWKIDYYDPTLTAGAEDPSDPARCVRVLTLMLADEY